jgi:hypothetical protein
MEWNKFEASPREYPEKVVATMTAGFPKATGELLEMVITPMSASDRMAAHYLDLDFLFNLYLRSPHVPIYKLKIMSFGYNVELAPIHSEIEETIFESVFKRRKKFQEIIKSDGEEAFKDLLKEIFSCARFKEVVSGVMKIASKGKM